MAQWQSIDSRGLFGSPSCMAAAGNQTGYLAGYALIATAMHEDALGPHNQRFRQFVTPNEYKSKQIVFYFAALPPIY
jgi:hypothetical protein